jgi:hypothetical protein
MEFSKVCDEAYADCTPRLGQRCLERPGSQFSTFVDVTMQKPPGRLGLYDPRHEHDSCGVSFVANIKGIRSHDLVKTGLRALTNLEHRGATGAEPDTGDGAGILLQIPDRLRSFRYVWPAPSHEMRSRL